MNSHISTKFAFVEKCFFDVGLTVFYMKISSSQMFRDISKWCFGALALLLFTGPFKAQAQGDALFKAKCATCHQIFKDGTGPKLFEARQKWSDGGAAEGSIFQWVNNWSNAAAADPYAQSVSTWSETAMTAFPDLSKEQITSIFDWVDSQEEVTAAVGSLGGAGGASVEQESGLGWVWIVLAIVFVVVILAVGGVRRQLKSASAEMEGEAFDDEMTYTDELKQWAWSNRKFVALGIVAVVLGLLVTLFLSLYSIGLVENS